MIISGVLSGFVGLLLFLILLVAVAMLRSEKRLECARLRDELVDAARRGQINVQEPRVFWLIDWFDRVAVTGRMVTSARHTTVRPKSTPLTESLANALSPARQLAPVGPAFPLGESWPGDSADDAPAPDIEARATRYQRKQLHHRAQRPVVVPGVGWARAEAGSPKQAGAKARLAAKALVRQSRAEVGPAQSVGLASARRSRNEAAQAQGVGTGGAAAQRVETEAPQAQRIGTEVGTAQRTEATRVSGSRREAQPEVRPAVQPEADRADVVRPRAAVRAQAAEPEVMRPDGARPRTVERQVVGSRESERAQAEIAVTPVVADTAGAGPASRRMARALREQAVSRGPEPRRSELVKQEQARLAAQRLAPIMQPPAQRSASRRAESGKPQPEPVSRRAELAEQRAVPVSLRPEIARPTPTTATSPSHQKAEPAAATPKSRRQEPVKPTRAEGKLRRLAGARPKRAKSTSHRRDSRGGKTLTRQEPVRQDPRRQDAIRQDTRRLAAARQGIVDVTGHPKPRGGLVPVTGGIAIPPPSLRPEWLGVTNNAPVPPLVPPTEPTETETPTLKDRIFALPS